jgi:hypothetical protein
MKAEGLLPRSQSRISLALNPGYARFDGGLEFSVRCPG